MGREGWHDAYIINYSFVLHKLANEVERYHIKGYKQDEWCLSGSSRIQPIFLNGHKFIPLS